MIPPSVPSATATVPAPAPALAPAPDVAAHGAPPLDGALPVLLAGVAAWLLPQRAVWLPARRALLVADVHLGKAASFRALGVPVPGGTTRATLGRIDALVRALAPDALVVLGDLLHGPAVQQAAAVDALARWRAGHAAIDVVLVRGNHDDRAGDPPAACGIRAVDAPWRIGPLALCHAPDDRAASETGAAAGNGAREAAAHVLCGHLHPVVRLRTRADALRLPCFWLRPDCTVLPAFGDFTGGALVTPGPRDTLVLTDGMRLHRLPPGRRGAAAAVC